MNYNIEGGDVAYNYDNPDDLVRVEDIMVTEHSRSTWRI